MTHLQKLLTDTREKRREELTAKFISFLIAIPIIALVFMWYNHVWIRWPIAFWQWLCFSIPFMLVKDSWIVKATIGVVAIVALFAQVGSWVGLVSLPLIAR